MSSRTRRTGPAETYLVHFFGGGLVDPGECYAVERFKAHADGDIRRWPAAPSTRTNGRTRQVPEIASVDEVRELRPAYNEIIVCTGLGTRSGVQFWGAATCSMFARRRRRYPR